MKNKAIFNWSGGKDSALALYKVLQQGEYDVVALLTTVNRDSQTSAMHSIPVSLLQKQADSIGIPLYVVDLISEGTKNNYEEMMGKTAAHFRAQGVASFIFGDIFLYDVKSYREKHLAPYGITVVEPLWDKSSQEVMDEFLLSGLQTVVITTKADVLDETFIGRHLDPTFVDDYPKDADICGETGEYHTFCYAGGMFKYPVAFSLSKPYRKAHTYKLSDGTEKEYNYWFSDLLG